MNLRFIISCICITITTLFIFYYTVLDIRYRILGEVRRRRILYVYPIVIIGSISIYGFNIISIIGMLFLIVLMYVFEVIVQMIGNSNGNIFGSIDIMMAPLYSYIFGLDSCYLMLTMIFCSLLYTIKPFRVYICNKSVTEEGKNMCPLLLTMTIAYTVFGSMYLIV